MSDGDEIDSRPLVQISVQGTTNTSFKERAAGRQKDYVKLSFAIFGTLHFLYFIFEF
jgi:hypothetical protein